MTGPYILTGPLRPYITPYRLTPKAVKEEAKKKEDNYNWEPLD